MQQDPSPMPRGELAVRTLAMPADTNPAGDIFGGWIMSLMDVAGGITAVARVGGRVATVAATDMAFLKPVKVGDVVCCYCDPARTGRTSSPCMSRSGCCARARASASRSPRPTSPMWRWTGRAARARSADTISAWRGLG
ncbi:acyl-CoA thioesterase [Siccirubricoccus deserti]